MKLILFLFVLFWSTSSFAVRYEIERYTLLRDRVLVESDVREIRRQKWFSLGLHISSGLRKLMDDLNSSSEKNTTAQKQAAILDVLNKNLNTERFVDLDLFFGVPLPDIVTSSDLHLSPSLFYNYNGGASLSLTNASDATNPYAQVYLKLEQQMGLHTMWALEDWFGNFAVYHMTRKDILAEKDQTSLVQNSDIIDTDDTSELDLVQETISADLKVGKRFGSSSFFLEVREYTLSEQSSASEKSRYGDNPLYHLRFDTEIENETSKMLLNFGFHQRGGYNLDDRFYLGFKYIPESFPLRFMTIIDNESLLLSPIFSWRKIRFSYSFKAMHTNPVDDVWIPNMHAFSLSIVF